ncbi:cell envelope integrity protein CreD [Thermomonas carbonis]|uniref:Cell envelope integrity protein CreD n=1 Tax=Thermomonas carbonis TaxID=1463158 RepID=A0A7G9SNP2_9GAMM|nr:cell envelope integrity protein CreD [Thermomonas carbonis]QNN69467.1 cell envelope integrity protein CreD [Thermomonas carbonis]GHB93305.1 cell envelope integrity protein CreD [Thermomonas carbonis]
MRLAFKAIMVVVLTLAILVPLTMVRGTINERQAYRQEAVEAVAQSYARAQGLAGPVLVVPYSEQVELEETDAKGVVRKRQTTVEGNWRYFPKTMTLEGNLLPSIRKRGLHQVRVYELQGALDATFDARIPDADPSRPRTLGTPWLDIGIADVRGLTGTPTLKMGATPLPVLQGQQGRNEAGMHALLPEGAIVDGRLAFPLQLGFALRGTEALRIAPLADSNRIVLASAWPHPQFNGDFLPRAPRIDGNGFKAEWEVSSLASNAQAQYRDGGNVDGKQALDAIGLSLVEPVDLYSKLDRASKYGLLFVLLTFVGFFMFETIRQLPIHPIQYLLVGLALAIFFLLLLGLSEHIAFGIAYCAASVACIGLLGFYLAHVLRSRARGIGFAAMLGLLYAALYGLLLSEDNALVLGSGLLFAILAAVMIATRKVDWYQVAARAPVPVAVDLDADVGT